MINGYYLIYRNNKIDKEKNPNSKILVFDIAPMMYFLNDMDQRNKKNFFKLYDGFYSYVNNNIRFITQYNDHKGLINKILDTKFDNNQTIGLHFSDSSNDQLLIESIRVPSYENNNIGKIALPNLNYTIPQDTDKKSPRYTYPDYNVSDGLSPSKLEDNFNKFLITYKIYNASKIQHNINNPNQKAGGRHYQKRYRLK
jgi:hypothetical protein